jgi:hypothetical protein
MSFDWKSVVGTVAPGIATALGGPLAGMAVTTLAKALGVESTEDAVSNVIASNDPSILLKIKEADLEFKKAMKSAEVDLEKIHVADRDSARNLAIKTTLLPQVILSSIFITAFSVILFKVFSGGTVLETMMQPAMYLLGMLSAGVLQIMNFFFGSSAGSKEKTVALANSKPV